MKSIIHKRKIVNHVLRNYQSKSHIDSIENSRWILKSKLIKTQFPQNKKDKGKIKNNNIIKNIHAQTYTTYTKRVGLYFFLIYKVSKISNQNYLVIFEMVKMTNGET